ncbi:MAG: BolA/IbaG family iron-sulfur metabolism protein [Oligoflexales bacterium]
MDVQMIESRLRETFPEATKIRAYDMTGGGDHWQLEVRAPEFEGKSLVQQHQMVYQSLGSWMHKEIHALALTTGLPE